MHLNMFLRTISLLLVATLFYGCPSEQLQSARNYVEQKNWEEAEKKLTAAIEVNPEEPEPYFLMGKEIYAQNGEWAKMNKMFDKAAELGPTDKLPGGQSLLATIETWRMFYWSGEYNKGADNFNLAIKAEDTAEKEGYFHLAIAGFNNAKDIKPDEPGSYKNLVFCYIQLDDQEMLESTLIEALNLNPEDPDLLFTAGKVFKDNGDIDKAIEYLERGLKINPGSAIGARYLADAYYDMGDIEGAVFAYTKAIRSDPDNPDLHFNVGVLYLLLDDFEMTEEEFQKVLKINPDDDQAAIGIGEAYEGMERWEDSEYYYKRALRTNPDKPSLLRALARVIYRQGRLDEAQEYLDIAKGNRKLMTTPVSPKLTVNPEPQYLKQKYPPLLTIEELKFIEPSGNQSLDGFETGKITFDLVNKGKGYATNIDVNITPLSSGKNLQFESKRNITKIAINSTETIEIPITADINVKTTGRKFRIEVSEHFGFDADPATISFTTTASAPPDLQINQTAIDDDDDGDSMGDGNSIIEPGESVEVTVFVQNFGDGDAEDVKAEVVFNTTDRNITYPDEGQISHLGDIASGDYKELKFYFFTSRRYDEVDLPISVKLTESKSEFGKTLDLGLKAGERTQNVVDVQITSIETTKKQKLIRQIEDIITLADVDKNIPNTKTKGKNTLAVIIGIQDYKYAPDADYADRDAQYFYEYSKSVLGVPEPNIYFRVDDGATSGEFNKIFAEDGWIARRLGFNTDVIFFYSGHGAPDPKSEKGYLIPHDIDPNYANTGFSIDRIYGSLADLKANSVTVFIDACFSGESRSEEMLIAGIRPISIQIINPLIIAKNFAVFSASTGKQYSSSYPEKFHGLFTYFLLKGLQGNAKGSDKQLTIGELYDYVKENVSSQAGYLDKEQNPTFVGGNKDRIIVRY